MSANYLLGKNFIFLESKACVNCGIESTGNFCNNCGQRIFVKRLTLREGWNDFWARIYGFDGMFPRTLRDLTIKPGLVSRDFLKGNRVKYYGPVGYFFFIITLMYLVASMLGVDLLDFFKNVGQDMNSITQQTPKKGSGQEQVMESVMRLISDNMKLFSFMIVPVQAFCARFIFFRKSGLNFIENMVLPLYTQGHVYWITICSIVIFSISDTFPPSSIQVGLTIFYTCYSYTSMFLYQSKLKVFFKGFGIYLVTQILFVLIISIVLGVVLFLNPGLVEMIKPSNNP